MKTMLTVLVVCTFLSVSCDDFLAKKTRSKIEFNCVMNGYGTGKCSFTNKGGPGSHCVKVKVFRRDNPEKSLISPTICSGNVSTRETKSKGFSIPGVNRLCSAYGKAWTKVCAFEALTDN